MLGDFWCRGLWQFAAVFQLCSGPGACPDRAARCLVARGFASSWVQSPRLELRGQEQGTAHGGRVGPMCTGQLTEPEPAVSVGPYLMAGCRLWLAS